MRTSQADTMAPVRTAARLVTCTIVASPMGGSLRRVRPGPRGHHSGVWSGLQAPGWLAVDGLGGLPPTLVDLMMIRSIKQSAWEVARRGAGRAGGPGYTLLWRALPPSQPRPPPSPCAP